MLTLLAPGFLWHSLPPFRTFSTPKRRLLRRLFGKLYAAQAAAWLPAIPAPLRSVDDEADEPDDEGNGGDPPQDVQGEPGAEQQERNDKKRYEQSHIPSPIPLTAVLPDCISYGW